MLTCLQCGDEAQETEVYEGIPIRTCRNGHRTGQIREALVVVEGFMVVTADLPQVEASVLDQIDSKTA